jgi:hypothetical protein
MTNDWNDEARMTNAEGMTNQRIQIKRQDPAHLWHSGFGRSFLLRHSDFVIAVCLRFCCNAEAMRA